MLFKSLRESKEPYLVVFLRPACEEEGWERLCWIVKSARRRESSAQHQCLTPPGFWLVIFPTRHNFARHAPNGLLAAVRVAFSANGYVLGGQYA